MTKDTKTPETIKDQDLDQAKGGFSFGVERELKDVGRPKPKGMERVFDDE
jgi:hypothetical protein